MALATREKLYLNEEQKDVSFLVGPDEQHRVRFPAHKLILSTCSSAFAAMFSPRFQEGITGEVIIKDVTPAAFRNVLQFAYAGTIEIPAVTTFKEILYAADKYLMVDLSKFCFDHLESVMINLDNFWVFFNIVCTFYSESMSPKIVIDTLKFLDDHAEKLFSNEEFKNLNSEAVLRIVSRSSLRGISEIIILQRVFQWSKVECCRQNLEVTVENERKILEKIKYDIRYLLISRIEMLENDVIMQTILTENLKKNMLGSTLRKNNFLSLPCINKLFSYPRGQDNVLRWNLVLDDNTVPPHNIFAIDLLLVVAYDCVFESIGIHYIPQNCSEVKITGEIADLNGNIYSTWVDKGTHSAFNLNEGGPTIAITTGKRTCLHKFKSYKLSLVVVNGHFVKKYKTNGICTYPDSRTYLILGNLPTSAATLNTIKSCNYWERGMAKPTFELNHNNFVSTIIIRC